MECHWCRREDAHKLSEDVVSTTVRIKNDGDIKHRHLRPGSQVSIGQFISSAKGRRSYTAWKKQAREKFVLGTVFID